MLINLKPRDERDASAPRDHPPAAAEARPTSTGITLYLQPVQDLTIEDRVSRTQYQFTLEDRRTPTSSAEWAPRLVERLRAAAAAARRRQRPAGRRVCRPYVDIDRDTAARLGVTPQTIDDALYNAFGQRHDLDHLHADRTSTAWCSR